MQNVNKLIWPPATVSGMKTLNRELFKKKISMPFITVKSTDKFDECHKKMKSLNMLMRMPAFKPVVHEENIENGEKIGSKYKIYLNPETIDESKMPEDTKVEYEDIELNYNNFDHHDCLRAILPDNVESVAGYSTVGHLIHLNLRKESIPFKDVIGQVLLDKVHGCRMVVNKLDSIDTKFRVFDMEVIAKDPNFEETTIVSTSDAKLKFKFDFAKVYWNPRLTAERPRIMKKLNNSVDVLYDVFAGVGPFVIPAAKYQKCRGLANDLNPESYKWLMENVKLNKLEDRIECYNLDGREFIQTVAKNDIVENYIKKYDGCDSNRKYHFVMNLPDIALQFLDVFDGIFSDVKEEHVLDYLHVHCYCFVKNIPEEEEREYVISEASKYLGYRIEEKDIDEIFNVRTVAPKKHMYRISFRIPKDIIYSTRQEEPQVKKARLD